MRIHIFLILIAALFMSAACGGDSKTGSTIDSGSTDTDITEPTDAGEEIDAEALPACANGGI